MRRLDNDFEFSWDLTTHAPKVSEFSTMCHEMLQHEVHFHVTMESSESSVKVSLHDKLHSMGATCSPAAECAKDRVKDNYNGFHAYQSPPQYSLSCVGYSIAYEPSYFQAYKTP